MQAILIPTSDIQFLQLLPSAISTSKSVTLHANDNDAELRGVAPNETFSVNLDFMADEQDQWYMYAPNCPMKNDRHFTHGPNGSVFTATIMERGIDMMGCHLEFVSVNNEDWRKPWKTVKFVFLKGLTSYIL